MKTPERFPLPPSVMRSAISIIVLTLFPGTLIPAEDETRPGAATVDITDVQAAFGAQAAATFNPATGTPHRIIVDKGVLDGVTPRSMEATALTWVDKHPEIYGVDPQDLRLEVLEEKGNLAYLIFRQTYLGVPVYQSRVDFRFRKLTGSWSLVLTGAEVFPDVQINPVPTFPADDALISAQIATEYLPGNADFIVDPPELYIYADEQAGTRFRLGWRLGLFVHHDDPGRYERAVSNYEVWVDAHTGEVFSVFDRVEELVISGTVTGLVKDLPYEVPTERPLAHMRVQVSDVGDTYTDDNGFYSIEAGTGDRQVTMEFFGEYIDINASNVADAQVTATVAPGSTHDVFFNDANSIPGERDTYYHGNFVHDWMLDLDNDFTGADYSMPAAVNIGPEDPLWPCNAYWNGVGINMFSAGGGCSATDQMADVVYHEYQHGLTQFAYDPFSSPYSSGMGEGLADYTAMTIMNSPCLGDAFFGTPGDCLRDGENTRQWPAPECGGEVHCLGEISMGALWKMRQNLITAMGDYDIAVAHSDTLFRWMMFGRPYTVPDLLLEILLVDDDDATLLNGTPNFLPITEAFAVHNVASPIPDIGIDHDPVANTDNTSDPIVITAVAASIYGEITTVELVYSIGPDVQTVGMNPIGNGTYQGQIPAQSAGSVVQYYIHAVDDQENNVYSPETAPDQTHVFLVGPVEAFQLLLDDDAETDLGWQLGAPGDNATTGIWERVDPIGTFIEGTPVQPEDDHTPTGSLCFVTGNAPFNGDNAGENDVDDGRTTLTSPVFNLIGMTEPVLSYWRWYSNDAGNAPGQDTWRVQVTNDGVFWIDLENTMETDNSWTFHQFLLTQYVEATQTVQVRFVAEDAGDGSLVEGAVDDIRLLNGFGIQILAGDVNFDGEVNVLDIVQMVNFVLGLTDPTALEAYAGDLNGDGELNVLDIVQMVNLILGDLPRGVQAQHATLELHPEGIYLRADGPVAALQFDVPAGSYRLSDGVTDMSLAGGPMESGFRYIIYPAVPGASLTGDGWILQGAFGAEPRNVLLSNTGGEAVTAEIVSYPRTLSISEVYPNPFNPVTTIRWWLPQDGRHSVKVFDLRGSEVATLSTGWISAGEYTLQWAGMNGQGQQVPSGVYIVAVEAGGQTESRKIILLK